MARNKTLLKLLDDFRAECRLSLNPAHNAQQRETQVKHLQRVQEYLYDDFDWPHLRCERLFAPQPGQRYYGLPDDVQLERIQHLEIRWSNIWRPLKAGIEPGHYAQFDSDNGVTYDPAARWRIWENDEIELWPVPASAGNPTTLDLMVKVVGIRRLRPLVDDADQCDLDDRLIVLYAAAEYLAANGATDAKLKLDQANKRYGSIKADLTPRRRIQLFGDAPARTLLRGMPPVQIRYVQDPGTPPNPDPGGQPVALAGTVPAGAGPTGTLTVTNPVALTGAVPAGRGPTGALTVVNPVALTGSIPAGAGPTGTLTAGNTPNPVALSGSVPAGAGPTGTLTVGSGGGLVTARKGRLAAATAA